MKVRADKNLDEPIHVEPGDVFQLVWHPPRRRFLGGKKDEIVLLEQKIEKRMTVNYVAALDLNEEELQQLGLIEALIGLFGNKEKA